LPSYELHEILPPIIAYHLLFLWQVSQSLQSLVASDLVIVLEEKPAHHPLEPLDVALKHTGWMPPAYLYSLAESAKVEGRRIVNSDIN